MDTWNATRFIDTVSRKIGTLPTQASGTEWGDVKAIHWSHPAHETSTKALSEHFLAVIMNPIAEVSWRVNSGPVKSISMASGALTYVPPGRPVDWVIGKPMTVLNLFLPEALVKAAAESIGTNYRDLLSGREWLGVKDDHIAKLTSIASDELSNGSPGGKLYIDSILAALCSRLVTLHRSYESHSAAPATQRVSMTSQQVKVIYEYMRANLDRDIGVHEISGCIGLSAFHFSRSFKSKVGVPPGRYFTIMRVERAQDLLSGTSLPISEIAVAVGMRSQSHLSHVFKRITGTTPAEYRRRAHSSKSN